MAETEKYPHVTYFLNGGREEKYPGEDRIMVPSPKVATYDLQPEMSAPELTDKAVAAIDSGKYDLIVLNFANPDMVGHTGSLPAAIKAVETVDTALGKIADAIKRQHGALLFTADHGNCEMMRDPVTGGPHTAHTTNPVPVVLVADDKVSLGGGPPRRHRADPAGADGIAEARRHDGRVAACEALRLASSSTPAHPACCRARAARPCAHCAALSAPRAKIMRSVALWVSSMRSSAPAKITLCSPATLPPRSDAKPMVARLARAGVTIARALGLRLQIDLAACGRRLAEQQRGAGRRIDLLVVMHLDDLDVEFLTERRRDLLRQHREQIDAEAHVAGLHDRGLFRGFRHLRVIGGRHAGGADDVREPGFGGERRERHGRGRNGEIDDAVGRKREPGRTSLSPARGSAAAPRARRSPGRGTASPRLRSRRRA